MKFIGAMNLTRETIRRTTGLRGVLLASAATLAVLPLAPAGHAAPTTPPAAPCDLGTAPAALCQGNVTAGVAISETTMTPAFTSLTVNAVTGDINPGKNISAIRFESNFGNVVIDSDVGANSIIVDGSSTTYGIRALSPNGGSVQVTSNGNITAAGGSGIYATSLQSSSYVKSTGNITAGNAGITAVGGGKAAVTLKNTGNVTSEVGGLVARANGGDLDLTSIGDIKGAKSGISASQQGNANLTITSTGKIESSAGTGIFANLVGSTTGVAKVISNGDIVAFSDGIRSQASATRTGSLFIGSYGAITSTDGAGILLEPQGASFGGSAEIKATGAITAKTNGISGDAVNGDVTITSTKSITSMDAAGIRINRAGKVSVTNTGVIDSKLIGVYIGNSSAAQVENAGKVTSSASSGILVRSDTSASVTAKSGSEIIAALYGVSVAGPAVAVINEGTINAEKTGIFAASFSGVPGPKSVTVNTTGNVTSKAASAIRAYGDADQLVAVTVGGVVTGASGFSGVDLLGTYQSNNNSLTVTATGEVKNAGGLNEFAVRGNYAVVENAGKVTGNVNFEYGVNVFTNKAGGLFTMGPKINLGSKGQLTNGGTIAPGGDNNVLTVNVTGQLEQTKGGTWRVDVDAAKGTADVILVSGAAVLDGTVIANDLGVSVTDSQEFLILRAAGGVTGSGLVLAGDVAPTLGLAFRCSKAGEACTDEVWLVAAGMPPPPPPPPPPPDADSGLRPQPYLQAAMAGVLGAQGFADALMGCREREGTYAYIADAQCIWLDTGGGYINRNASGSQFAADQTSWWLGGGVQFALSDTLHAGVGVRYEDVSQDVHDNARNDGWWGHAGASLSYNPGPWLLAGAVSGGRGQLDTHRDLSRDGFDGVAKGEQDLSYVQGKLRAGYLIDYGQWYLKPLIDLDAVFMSFGDVNEEGGDGGALRIDSAEQTVWSATPRLEIGGQLEMANGAYVRPYVQLGAAIYADTGMSLDARFEDEALGIPEFTTETDLDRVLADVSVGLDILSEEGLNLRLSYDGQFGETTESHAGTLRAEWRF